MADSHILSFHFHQFFCEISCSVDLLQHRHFLIFWQWDNGWRVRRRSLFHSSVVLQKVNQIKMTKYQNGPPGFCSIFFNKCDFFPQCLLKIFQSRSNYFLLVLKLFELTYFYMGLKRKMSCPNRCGAAIWRFCHEVKKCKNSEIASYLNQIFKVS